MSLPPAFYTSAAIAKDPSVAAALGRPMMKAGSPKKASALKGAVVVGWGIKPNTAKARAFAAQADLPFLALEDGFLAYMGHGQTPRLSLIADSRGIYYDAQNPSDLEVLIQKGTPLDHAEMVRIDRVIARIKAAGISKYNHAPQQVPDWLKARLADHSGDSVLLVDQTAGDMSISGAGADGSSFRTMLQAARTENPEALIVIKVHPDVLAGRKQGHFSAQDADDNTILVADAIAPQALFERVSKVYVISSQMGFEALLAGLPVTCFGRAFYAGWGLTDDRLAFDRRTNRPSLADLAHRVLIDYPTYVDSVTSKRCEIENVLDILEAERAITRPGGGSMIALGFSLWKRAFLGHFLTPRGAGVRFSSRPRNSAEALVLWGRTPVPSRGVDGQKIWRVEDGFIRSSGLGSDLRRPSSLMVDGTGIYFDATAPNDLECFLGCHRFQPEQKARAVRLMERLQEARVSKYNVGKSGTLDFQRAAKGREVILVPGQVESDASIRYGSPDIQSNEGLLKAVRADYPEAYIIFKPHPDLVAGNRDGGLALQPYDALADQVVVDVDIVDCIEAADRIATLTSLTGFEALLRNTAVTTYGLPFYAGWGLTEDRLSCDRRGRQLAVEDLVYGALIAYPRYVDWATGYWTTPEAVVTQLEAAGQAQMDGSNFLVRLIRKIRFLAAALLR